MSTKNNRWVEVLRASNDETLYNWFTNDTVAGMARTQGRQQCKDWLAQYPTLSVWVGVWISAHEDRRTQLYIGSCKPIDDQNNMVESRIGTYPSKQAWQVLDDYLRML